MPVSTSEIIQIFFLLFSCFGANTFQNLCLHHAHRRESLNELIILTSEEESDLTELDQKEKSEENKKVVGLHRV